MFSRVIRIACVRVSIFASVALLGVLAAAGPADARGKLRECKPNGQPIDMGTPGAIEIAQAVDYSGELHVVAADKAEKPSRLHLMSTSGEPVALAAPPWTLKPSRFLSRGRGVYAVGTGRSQTEGKVDIVLVRWGTDSRPRLTKVATLDRVIAEPRAAMVGEHMAVLWAEPSPEGGAQVMASFLDVEELRVRDAQALGALASDGFVEIVAAEKGFLAVWTAQAGVMRKRFDLRGKSEAAALALKWQGGSALRAAIACGERLWLLHEGGRDSLSVSTTDAAGVVRPVARLAATLDAQRSPLLCADENVVVAHRTVNEKAGNVVFWLSTVEPSGKTHERRVKDVAGDADTIRMPLLAVAGDSRSAFWVEGAGATAKLWSRQIVCE